MVGAVFVHFGTKHDYKNVLHNVVVKEVAKVMNTMNKHIVGQLLAFAIHQ